MLPQRRYFLALVFSVLALSVSPIAAYAADPVECRIILNTPANGQAAINALGNQFDYVATLNRMTSDQLKAALLASPEYYIDKCGRAFFAETTMVAKELPLPMALDSLPNPLTTGNGIGARPFIDPSIIFKLHSNSSSKKILYLNFKGRQITNTSWNANYNHDNAWFANGFSQDSDYSKFNVTEMEVIQSVWQRVADDYAPFDIDVTTQEPTADQINRTDASDKEYGTEVVISSDTVIFNSCKCSGLAYLGAFDLIGKDHIYNQPAWVFTQGVGDNPKYIAEAITHEAGHTFGLSHSGTDSSSYYSGLQGWAPIMGVGFYQPLTQWSKGEYPSANNNEDAYSLMLKHGLTLRNDEDSNTAESARTLKLNDRIGGVITSPSDVDYFAFTVNNTDNYTIKALPATFSPNLDINLRVFDASNMSLISENNPPLKIINNDVADGMSASYTGKFVAQKKYVIAISGSKITVANSSSNYGSVGTYQIQLELGSNQKIEQLPGLTSSVNPGLNTSASKDISTQLITPVLTDGVQGLELPNNIQARASNFIKRLSLHFGILFE